jgi:hypothetical protein
METIIPEAPDLLWGTDATMALTKGNGWVLAFCVATTSTREARTTVAQRGDRFACLGTLLRSCQPTASVGSTTTSGAA